MNLTYQPNHDNDMPSLGKQQNFFLHLLNIQKKDTEKLKEAYEAEIQCLKDVIDNLPASIYWKDKNGVYLGNNLFAREKMRSIGLTESVIGKTDYDLFDKDVADKFRENDLIVIKNNQTLSQEEVTVADGMRVAQLSIKKPMHDKLGNVIGIIGNTVDITELKRTEESLALAKQKAEESNYIKTQFIENMEHDIRTPFTGIWTLTSKLFKIESDTYKKELLGAVVTCSKELLDYCNSIIDLVRLKNHPTPVIAKKFDLYKLIQSIIDIELPPALEKGVPLLIEYPEALPRIWVSDPYRLKRILINLLSNSVKFTKKGHIKISVQLGEKILKKRSFVRIYIEDTGIGISEDKQRYIYEEFYRATPSNQGIYQGIGLGLSIVKQLIEEMQGELEYKSKMDQGSTFLCTIPMSLPLVNDLLDQE